MCTVLLPPGGYPIAVDKFIISYQITWLHVLTRIWFSAGQNVTQKIKSTILYFYFFCDEVFFYNREVW